MPKENFLLGLENLTIAKLIKILDGKIALKLSDEAIKKVKKSQGCVDKVVKEGRVTYGVNTGFGVLCDQIISAKDTGELQANLLKSHAVGVGKAIPGEIAKLMLIIKAHALAQGFSGVSLETLKRIIWHIEEDIIPVVPEKGSVGASGDLAPLSHLFLPLIGLGEVVVKGKKYNTAEFFAKNKIKPIELKPKEGLGLINGTQFMAAFGAFGLHRFHHLLEQADIIAALTIDAVAGSVKPFDARLHAIRPFVGNRLVAQRISTLLQDSKIGASHLNCSKVQDPYSLRCVPQIHGASRNAWLHVKETIEIELNSVTDNPIVLNENEIVSGGGFHGQPIAMALDYATLAAAELGNVADRRCYLMLEGEKYGLPAFLLKNSGLNSGFMIPQYTTAALVSENKSLCFPASADSIPTSLGQEDHVSMGSISSRKFNMVLDNLEYIQAIELMYATQALEFRRPLKSSKILEEVFALVRKKVDFKKNDTVLYHDINALHALISSFEISKKAQILNKNFNQFIL
jgi:histidine ammonia-lyase